jgi:hypothetical protein
MRKKREHTPKKPTSLTFFPRGLFCQAKNGESASFRINHQECGTIENCKKTVKPFSQRKLISLKDEDFSTLKNS